MTVAKHANVSAVTTAPFMLPTCDIRRFGYALPSLPLPLPRLARR